MLGIFADHLLKLIKINRNMNPFPVMLQTIDDRPVGLEAQVDQYLLQQTRSYGRRST